MRHLGTIAMEKGLFIPIPPLSFSLRKVLIETLKTPGHPYSGKALNKRIGTP